MDPGVQGRGAPLQIVFEESWKKAHTPQGVKNF